MNEIVNYKNREEWLAARQFGIGASEAASAIGLNPYQTPYQLWRLKLGIDPPVQENKVMRAGHILEPAVAEFFAQETGAKIIKSSEADFMFIDKDKPYLRVSPDRLYTMPDEKGKRILECKTTRLAVDEENIPVHWFVQIQMNLGVAGLKHGAIAWLINGSDFNYKEISFDPDFFKMCVDAIDEFWNVNVLQQIEPSLINVSDVLAKFPQSNGKEMEASDVLLSAYQQLKTVKEEIANLKTSQARLEDEIKFHMLDNETVTYDRRKIISWKSSKESNKFNEAKFALEHPELYQQYLEKKSGTRRFLVK